MKNIYNFIIFFLAITPFVTGQVKHDYQWVLNQYNHLYFRSDTLVLDVLDYTVNHGPGNYSTSICDQEGELLFYSGGCFILNKENEIMENGDSINSEYAYIDFCGFGDFPTRQNNTIIPLPDNDQRYIYFNLDIHIINIALPAPLHLYYHIIDMNEDSGLGAIVEKKQIAISDTLARGYVQAVRHANGMDWWVIASERNSNCYYILPVTQAGVGIPEKQCIGGIWDDLDGGGQAAFSPDETKYVRIGGQVGLYLFDFDNENGLLSNPLELTYPYDQEYFRGVSFSPNSRYLYVTAQLDVFQYDLQAFDIQESIQLVGQLNPDNAMPGVGSLALQKLAPDGRIYIASPGSHKYLSVIRRPNCPGELCDFRPWSVELPAFNYSGLPNLPHFSIPESDDTCDPITSTNISPEKESFRVFPNPTTGIIYIENNYQYYELYDLSGKKIRVGTKTFFIDLSDQPTGVYFLRLVNKKTSLTTKVMKE